MTATVLVVDDEPRIRELHATWLSGEYDVLTAGDGEEALAALDDDVEVDVVLLDRRMPGLSGDEVLDEMRDRGHDAWVVMVTAVDPGVDVVELDFDDYLTKPVRRDDLVGAVESMLRRDAHDEALRAYFEAIAKLGMLEATHSRQELRNSEEYERLQARLRDAKASLSDAVEAARTTGDFEELFVEFPEGTPDDMR